MRHHGGAASWIVASFLLICLSPLAFGAQLDVEIGIGGYVSRWSYAPVRVTISGLSHPVDGRIRLAQLIGNPTEDPAHIGSVVYAGKLVDRTYEATIPIYDPLNPVRIEVDDGEGSLAVCGISLMPVDDTVLIDPSELPITDPHLATAPDGTEYLAGELKKGALVSLARNGIPLLIIGRCACGRGGSARNDRRSAELPRRSVPRDRYLNRFGRFVYKPKQTAC